LVVMVWEAGVIATVGAFAVQVATFRVVVTLALPFACPDADAVTVVVFVPVVCPDFALTVSVIGLLVAPGARLTDNELNVEALNAVVFVSEGARVKVTFEHADPVSLFFTVAE